VAHAEHVRGVRLAGWKVVFLVSVV
jgi:hypothetical protein